MKTNEENKTEHLVNGDAILGAAWARLGGYPWDASRGERMSARRITGDYSRRNDVLVTVNPDGTTRLNWEA